MTEDERAAMASATLFFKNSTLKNKELFDAIAHHLSGYKSACDTKRAEIEQLHLDAQNSNAAHMDRGAAMRETGDMVRSLYAPKLEAERARSQKLFSKVMSARRVDSISKVAEYLDQAIAEYKTNAPSVEDLTKHGE